MPLLQAAALSLIYIPCLQLMLSACNCLQLPFPICPTLGRFDFWDYIAKSMEDDFAQIVGVSLEM